MGFITIKDGVCFLNHWRVANHLDQENLPFSISQNVQKNRKGESQAGVSHPAALRKVTHFSRWSWVTFLWGMFTSKTWGRFEPILMNISLIVQMCGLTITWHCFRLIWKEWGLTGWVGLEFPKKKRQIAIRGLFCPIRKKNKITSMMQIWAPHFSCKRLHDSWKIEADVFA